MSFITYFVPTWREVYFAISLPTLGYIALWFLIPDSPRWHLRKGHFSHALKIITNGAEVNNRLHVMHENYVESLKIAQYVQERKSAEGGNWFDLWKTTNLLNIVCAHLAWGGTLTNFNGMLLNTRNFGVDTLNQNVFLTGNCFNFCFIFGHLTFCRLIYRYCRAYWRCICLYFCHRQQ